jgi:hypothetical protein
MNNSGRGKVIFREVQQFRQPLAWVPLVAVLVVTLSIFGWGALFAPNSPGAGKEKLVALVILGVGVLVVGGLAYLFYLLNLTTEVRTDGLYVRYYPFQLSFKKIPLDKVRTFYATTYRPILQYGGWGLRYGLTGTAYNVGGNRGVKIEFIKGRHLLIGSQRAEELAYALEQIVNRPGGRKNS